MAEGQKEEKKCFICGATKNLGIPFPISGKQPPKIPNGIAQQADESAAVTLKMELKHTKIKRVITLPGRRSLHDLHYIIQAMFGFENDHLWNFQDRDGNEYNTCCDPLGGPLDMNTEDKLEPSEYTIDYAMPEKGDALTYEYDYGDGWEISVTRMADPKTGEIACVETRGTNAMDDIGGVPGLEGFIKALKKCKLKGTEDDPEDDRGWPIADWGYDDPEKRKKFLAGPTTDELTQILRDEVAECEEREKKAIEAELREQVFRKTDWPERPLPLRQWQEVQEMLRRESMNETRARHLLPRLAFIDGRQPTTDGCEGTADSRRPTTAKGQPTPDDRRPTAGDRGPGVGCRIRLGLGQLQILTIS